MMAKTENGRQLSDTRSIRTISSSHIDDGSSLGSDSEINGFTSDRQTDKYGFIGGAQQYSEESAQNVPPEVLRQREVKWLDMLAHWDKWMIKRFNKVRLRCQKGIPPALRGRAWLYLSGGKVKKEQNHGKFQELDSQPGDPKWLDVIEKDLHRQFPFHEMFVSRGGHGQQDLFRVLKAYTLYRPEEGYCQAQAPIAAVLLMHMPAEDAFWGLVQICEKYLPGYYSPGLEAIQLDGEILFALLRRVSPVAFRHLDKHKIDPVLYMTEWFMCAFSRTLPWASVLRVWDMFLCDGVKIIFRVGLVLLRCTLGTREKLKNCQGLYETMELLRAIDPRCMQEGFLVREILEIPVTARDIDREHHSQIKRWRKNRGELNFRPPQRMHGARLIMLAEPPSRQDLRQNPTIVIETSKLSPQLKKNKEERKSKKKKKSMKKTFEEIPNPYPLPTDTPLQAPDSPAPPPDSSMMLETSPKTKTDSFLQQEVSRTEDSPFQQQAPPTKDSPLQLEAPPTENSPLQQVSPSTEGSPLELEAPPTKNSPLPQEAPPPKDSPLQQEAPPIKDSPLQKEAPPPKDSPLQQEAPPIKDSPLQKEAPPPKESPLPQEAPPTEDSPFEQKAPPTEDSPLEQKAPPTEDSPLEQKAPPTEDSPLEQKAPPTEDSLLEQKAPPTDLAANESTLKRSTQSLSSTEQDTYL